MSRPPPTLREATRVWLSVAAQSFGGPAGQIAVMHRLLVEEKGWVEEEQFLHALNFCMLLPGPEAQQLATYLGWRLHGTRGGLIAGSLFVLPGFLAIGVLSAVYATYQQVGLVQALFFGLRSAVLVIVLEAVWRIGRRALKHPALWWLAGAAFVALFFLGLPFPLVVLTAGVLGWVGSRRWPEVFGGAASTAQPAAELGPRPTLGRTLRVGGVGLAAWFGPLLLLGAWLGFGSVFWQQAKFFSALAVVTFGGAYAALSYVAQQAVGHYGWLQPGEMLTGLGLAETTPGPLIQVVQYVGFLGAYRQPAPFSPLGAGVLASLVVTWATYAPCFLWIFLGAPYIERLRGHRALSGALSAITAAVVGVILNLSVWFALHTLFGRVGDTRFGPLHLSVPDSATLNLPALLVAALAGFFLWHLRWGTPAVLAASCLLGALLWFGTH